MSDEKKPDGFVVVESTQWHMLPDAKLRSLIERAVEMARGEYELAWQAKSAVVIYRRTTADIVKELLGEEK